MATVTVAKEQLQKKKTHPIKIAFFEIEDWEIDYYRIKLPLYDLVFYTEPISNKHLDEIKEVNILSVRTKSRVNRQVIRALPNLNLIVTRTTGFDHIDLDGARARGVAVSNIPAYSENTVAEHTFALILALAHNVHKAYKRTLTGQFDIEGLKGFDIKGKTLGIIGTGKIGLHVIKIARGFQMQVLAYDPKPQPNLERVLGFQYVDLASLLKNSDIITLHAPYNPATHHLINRDNLARLKKGAILINTARGGLVDTNALVWALDQGILAGAGLDVLEGEEFISEEWQAIETQAQQTMKTLLEDHILMHRDDVIITPHIAFYSKEASERIAETTVANIESFLKGEPVNLVEARKEAAA